MSKHKVLEQYDHPLGFICKVIFEEGIVKTLIYVREEDTYYYYPSMGKLDKFFVDKSLDSSNYDLSIDDLVRVGKLDSPSGSRRTFINELKHAWIEELERKKRVKELYKKEAAERYNRIKKWYEYT